MDRGRLAGLVSRQRAEDCAKVSWSEAQPRSGKYRTGRDRIILLDEQEPDRELALIILDYTPTRLVAFDETIESDRRLVKCR